jgi:acyl carrier protein
VSTSLLRQDVAAHARGRFSRNQRRLARVVKWTTTQSTASAGETNVKDSSFHSVCRALGSHLGIDPERFRAAQHLSRDWGLDELDLNMIALRLEELEGIELSSVELSCVETVGQLVNLFRQRSRSLELESWMNQLDLALHSANRARERRWPARDRRATH